LTSGYVPAGKQIQEKAAPMLMSKEFRKTASDQQRYLGLVRRPALRAGGNGLAVICSRGKG